MFGQTVANWKASSHFVPKINRMHTDIHNNIFQMSGELTDHSEAIVALFTEDGDKCHLHFPSFLSDAWTWRYN